MLKARNENVPQVSAIMPAYNAEATLEEAIESVIAQTFTDWELVIVDDGSTDATWNIISSFAATDSRIKAVRDVHRGRGYARNRCLERSRGTYIAICDSDDICLPKRFKIQLDFLEAHPEIMAVGSSYISFSGVDRGGGKVTSFPQDSATISKEFRKRRMKIANCTAMIRSDLFQRFGCYEDQLHRAQDYALFRRAELGGALFVNLNRPLVIYRESRFPSLRLFLENGIFHRYADYLINGGHLSFERYIETTWAGAYRLYLVLKYFSYFRIKQAVRNFSGCMKA